MPQHPACARRDRATCARDGGRRPCACAPTVRRRAGGPQLPVDAADDTRPVTRDWLLGAPAGAARRTGDARAGRADRTTPAGRPDADDGRTQAVDLADSARRRRARPDDATGRGRRPGVRSADGRRRRRPTPRTARRPATSRPPTARAAPGGAAAPSSSRPAPSPSWPPPTASTCWSPRGDIPRSTVVAGVDIGGLSPAAAAEHARGASWPRASPPTTPSSPTTWRRPSPPPRPGITLDVDGTVDAADDQPLNPWTRLVTLFSDREVDPVITGEDTALAAQIETDRRAGRPRAGRRHHRHRGHHAQRRRRPPTAGRWTATAPPTPSPPPWPPAATPTTPIELPVDVAPVHVDRAEAAAGARRDGHARAVGAGVGRRRRTATTRPRCRSPRSPPR